MLLMLDVNDQRPLHEQAASALRGALERGELAPGERVPPARDLAGALGINANTVLRALRRLRAEGLLEFRRGRGISVVRQPEAGSALRARVEELVADARKHGFGVEDVVAWVQESGSDRKSELEREPGWVQ